jgi:hypothetical protein
MGVTASLLANKSTKLYLLLLYVLAVKSKFSNTAKGTTYRSEVTEMHQRQTIILYITEQESFFHSLGHHFPKCKL